LQPAHRLIAPSTLIVVVLGFSLAGWIAYESFTGGPNLRVEVVDVAGYTDNQPVWLPFTLTLQLTNDGDESITIRRIDVEPDLDDFNEAFSAGTAYDLSPPMLLDPGVGRRHELSVTVLNANQLPDRTYKLVFIIRLQTDAGEITQRFPTQFVYFRDPARRTLRLEAWYAPAKFFRLEASI
jgi:hypothetical protein